MTTITERLQFLRQQIEEACLKADRDPLGVQLLAVSKTQPMSAVSDALSASQIHFGENFLQEALPKVQAYRSASWHFIGAIQSNKTRDIAANFDWVHSVSSLKIARRLSEQRPPSLAPLKAMIQVNISGEASKAGVTPDEARVLACDMQGLSNLELVGLMAVPAANKTTDQQRQVFAELRHLKEQIETSLAINLPHLSMGMSGDFHAAIMEGATWIRIGTAIFGARPTQP